MKTEIPLPAHLDAPGFRWIQLPGPNHFFTLEINTYADLRLKGEIVSDFIQCAMEILEPLAERFTFIRDPLGSASARVFVWNEKNGQKLHNDIVAGKLSKVYLAEGVLEEEVRKPPYAGITSALVSLPLQIADLQQLPALEEVNQRTPKGLAISIRPVLLGGKLPEELVAKLKQLAIDFFQPLEACNGYMGFTHDGFHPPDAANPTVIETMYDIDYGYPFYRFGINILSSVRGIFWGNFMGPTHLKPLGGIEKVRAEAPCHKVQEFSTSGGQGAFLQLTQDPMDYTAEDLIRLKRYLQPVMPKWPGTFDRVAGPPGWRFPQRWTRHFSANRCPYSMHFARSLTPIEREAFVQLVDAWFTVGHYCGFPGLVGKRLERWGKLKRLWDFTFNRDGDAASMLIDLGDIGVGGLAYLNRCLEHFNENQVPIAEVIGGTVIEPAP